MRYHRRNVGIGKVYRDRRLLGVEQQYLGRPRDFGMRVPNEILSCVAYIYATNQQGDSDNALGTAFFVSVPSESLSEKRHTYLVTAKHLLKSTGLSLQYNSKGGKRDSVGLPNAQRWYAHPDKGIDIVALLLDDDDKWLADVEYKGVPSANFAHRMDVDEYNPIGIGDDLLVTGLLVSHPGTERYIPIVRAGIISAMPGDPLNDRDEKSGEEGPPYIAYLAELHSTGGLSGSPVFVVIGPVRMVQMGNDDPWHQAGGVGTMSIGLLGVIRGHWYTHGDSATAGALADPSGEVNRGIAKVTPIKFLEEILMDETKSLAKADRVERDS